MPSIVLGARDIRVLQCGEGEMIKEISVICVIVAVLKKGTGFSRTIDTGSYLIQAEGGSLWGCSYVKRNCVNYPFVLYIGIELKSTYQEIWKHLVIIIFKCLGFCALTLDHV